jgi:hypothetical protein
MKEALSDTILDPSWTALREQCSLDLRPRTVANTRSLIAFPHMIALGERVERQLPRLH